MKPDALVRVLIRDRAKLLGYIWAILRDHHLADDVFQDVTVLAIERAADFNDEGHLLLWSRKTARFKALEVLRGKPYRTMSLSEEVLDMLAQTWECADAMNTQDEAEYLKACVDQLTPRSQEILHLRYTEGLTGVQVAEAINVQVGSVYVALTRIYQTLEKCIQQRRVEAGQANG
jgi:RNA polymerase sigma-70 factor (ECF subfamily)